MTRSQSHYSVGASVFNLLTIGMYDSPLAVYREYVQNACDAIRSDSSVTDSTVYIRVDPLNRCVTVRDTGPGLPRHAVERELVTVAQSSKQRGTDIGFRGIGRLCGLAFADRVVFRTRSSAKQKVVQLMWDGITLRRHVSQNNINPNEVIEKCVEVSELNGSEWPDHFFEVELSNIARYSASELLNEDLVRAYIAEVCPVPLDDDFPYSCDVQQIFKEADVPLNCIDVRMCGSEEPIKRPFGSVLVVEGDREHSFRDFESFYVPSVDGHGPAAIGWLAHTDYFGAIPKNLRVRGLRLREGNLQIGSEETLDHLFPEGRFNRWCVGEVHVVDPRIVPNGRRAYFEPSPHTRHLENQLESITRNISKRCRNASSGRYGMRKTIVTLEQTEVAYKLATSGYLKAQDARILVQMALKSLHEIYDKTSSLSGWSSYEQDRLEDLELRLKTFRPKRGRPALGRVQNTDISTYQKVFWALTKTSPTPEIALKMIEGVLATS